MRIVLITYSKGANYVSHWNVAGNILILFLTFQLMVSGQSGQNGQVVHRAVDPQPWNDDIVTAAIHRPSLGVKLAWGLTMRRTIVKGSYPVPVSGTLIIV